MYYVYHNIQTFILFQVCRDFFCKTLAVSYKPIAKAHQESSDTGEFFGQDQRSKHEPRNKLTPDVFKKIKDHIESFPMVDSHYCRKTTDRKYLSSKLSLAKMYDFYIEATAETAAEKVSYEKYKQVFGMDYNLAFHRPRKGMGNFMITLSYL